MINFFFLLLYVALINWNIGLYTLALGQNGRSKFIVIAINIFVSFILGYLSIYR
jgi:hypothetical protein